MKRFHKRALRDLLDNRFLSAVTIITISLSILIVGASALFFVNADELVKTWQQGIRVMIYLKPDLPEAVRLDLKQNIQLMYGVESVTFISKEDALNQMKSQMKQQSSLFENLEENPLPDAFDVRMAPTAQTVEQIEALAVQMESLEWVDEVEYGRQWLGKFMNVIKLFKFTGIAVMVVFFLAALFIVGNTIRLVLYSRRDEVEIMRLVGATDRFITAPFYIEGLIQGALGGIIGLLALFVTFLIISMNVEQGLSADFFQIRFLPLRFSFAIILVSTLVGWIGCFLSIKQYLKT